MHRIDQTFLLTAANADVLASSALDPIPGNGFVRVFASDIVATATIEIDPSNHPSPTGTGPQVVNEAGTGDSAANHPTLHSYDPHWETEVFQGEKLAVRIAGTVSECAVWVQYMGRAKG